MKQLIRRTSRCYLLVIIIVFTGCSTRKAPTSVTPKKVTTEIVTRSENIVQRSYVGVIEEEAGAAISFGIAGKIEKIHVREGEPVHKGQLLAQLDDASAHDLLDAASATLEQAKDAHSRLKQMYDGESLPEIKMVEINTKLQQALSTYNIARKNYDDCMIYAPFDGVVGKKNLSAGETAIPGQPVLTLVQINQVKAKFTVPEMEISNLTPACHSCIRVAALNNRIYEGGNLEKGVVANPVTRTYDARVVLANPDKELLPGMVCSVTVTPGSDTRITLPLTAVQRDARGQLFVWKVAADSTAFRAPVTTAATAGNRIAITKGLTPGERVITEGYQKISEGNKIIF